ncbi:MAG: pilus assembly PilX N-terminal domain-containing protein [Patescibacteria group bacterium]
MPVPHQAQKGQVLLIVILVMVVTITVGLSVVSHSITSLRTSKEDQTSQLAFSAAEAGVEKIISSINSSISGTLTNNASYTTSITALASPGSVFLINNGNAVSQDDGADVWLSTYPSYASPFNGNITVYWGQPNEVCAAGSTNTQVAIEIVTITGLVSAPVITHYNLDPCAARASANNFSTSMQGSATLNGVTFAHRFTINGMTNGLLMRVIPLYHSSIIGVSGNGTALPAQGQVIESTGTSGQTKRKVSVFKGFPRLPVELYPSLIFSH